MAEEVIAIEGGHKLNGTVTISGAKNATVALIPSIVLSDEPVEIYNVPEISDVDALTELLEELNCVVERNIKRNSSFTYRLTYKHIEGSRDIHAQVIK